MAETLHRTQFCTAREVIVPTLAGSRGFYFGETEEHGRTFSSLEDAVTRLTDDNAISFLRFDLDMNRAEDVTEEFASEYLRTFKGSPEDDYRLPIYVKTSQAWDAFCEDYTVENGLAFTQRSHGTVNHRQQFGR